MKRAQILLIGLMVCLLPLAIGTPVAGQEDEGVWLEADLEALGEAGSDSLMRDPWLDRSAPIQETDLDYFQPSTLNFSMGSLDEHLRANLLPEHENESFTEIFSTGANLALSLFQLRGEEYPRYHQVSDLWIYIWRGRGKFTIEEEEYDYGPGQFIQVPAGMMHHFSNLSGAPTIALVWQRPPLVEGMTVEIVPEEVLQQITADSLRLIELQEKSIYKSSH